MKILVLKIGTKSIRLAEPSEPMDMDESDALGWQLLVTPALLAQFINEEARPFCPSNNWLTIEEVEDKDRVIDDLRTAFLAMKERFAKAMADVRVLTDAVARVEKAIGYKHLEEQYPKHEEVAQRQKDEALLRSAEAGASPVLPVQTKPMRPWDMPRVHDMTGRHPSLPRETYVSSDPRTSKIEEIVKESRTKVDYDAARAKAASQPALTLKEVENIAEQTIDETDKPFGVHCALCGEQTTTCICAGCAAAIDYFDHPSLPDPTKPITFGRAKYLRDWLETCFILSKNNLIILDERMCETLQRIVAINELDAEADRAHKRIVLDGESVARRIVAEGQLANPLAPPPSHTVFSHNDLISKNGCCNFMVCPDPCTKRTRKEGDGRDLDQIPYNEGENDIPF